MAKEHKNKAAKPRAKKYDSKLAINASFADVIKASVSKNSLSVQKENKKKK